MRKQTISLAVVVIIALSGIGATIKFFTDYANSIPVGSDFFVLQRNQSYINSSVSQVKGDWFNNPVFTGNGSISGSFTANNYFGDGSALTGITASFGPVITNNTFINTNVAFINLETNNIFVNTNVSFINIETNNTFVNTNVTILSGSSNYINNVFETNVTIVFPGGATNLNLTPNSLMQADVNDAEASVPNGTGILTNNGAGVFGWVAISGLGGNYILANNGNGTNTTNWGVSYFQEVDAQNFFPTNLFTGLTNYPVLGTDGNGLLILGSATNSFTSTTIIAETNIVNYNYSTNLFFISGKGNTLIITNVSIENSLTNKGVSASSIIATDAKQVETNATIGSGLSFSANVLALSVQPTNEVTRQINSGTNIYTSLGTSISDISTATNLSYAYKIRTDIGNGVVTFGQGIFTNISADRTLASFTYGLIGANGYETAIIGVTNSDTAVHTLTMPANVIGKPGKVAPGVFYITNGVCTQISVAHMMNLFTNATTDF